MPRCPICYQRVPATHGVLAEHTVPGGTVLCSVTQEIDDEYAQALERLDEQHRAALYLANAERGDNEANDVLLQEMLQRMRAAGPPPPGRDC